jgi:hypothetical protein
MAVVFGVATAPGSYGEIQNFTSNKSIEFANYRDENGDVAGEQGYNESEEVSFEYVFDGTAPEVGVTLTITTTENGGAKKFAIDSTSMAESNTDFKRMTVTAHRFFGGSNVVPT